MMAILSFKKVITLVLSGVGLVALTFNPASSTLDSSTSEFFFGQRQVLAPSVLSPKPELEVLPIPLSESFRRLLPLVTSTSADLNIYNHLVSTYTYSNKTEECGNWQGAYTELHADVLAGRREGKVLVSDGPGGMGDKLTGYVSTFILALLMDCAWTASSGYTTVVNKIPDLRFGFDSPHINWSRTGPIPEDAGHLSGLNLPRAELLKKFVRVSKSAMLALIPKQVTQVVINRGLAINFLQDEEYWAGEKLRGMGLTKENVYGCVLNYLFRPIASTQELLAKYHGLLAHPTVFSVSIQLRLGDELMRGQDPAAVDLHRYDYAFQCAARLSEMYGTPNQKHLIMSVQSDFAPLAQQAADDVSYFLKGWEHPVMGKAHAFSTGVIPKHVDDDGDKSKVQQVTFAENARSFQTTVIDNWVQDSANYRLASMYSGFAIISGLRSWKQNGATMLELSPDLDCSQPGLFFSIDRMVLDAKSA